MTRPGIEPRSPGPLANTLLISQMVVDFAVPADYGVKLTEKEKKDKYLDLARGLEKLWNMNVTIILIVIGASGTVIKGTGVLGATRRSGDHPNYYIIENV